MKRGKLNYKAALKYLFDSLPMYQRDGGVAFKSGLENTHALLNELGNPQNKFKSIHIAGTNGKGSVSHMLCSVLIKAGYRTGLYTSPHLLDYRERIRVNGKKIEKKFVKDFVQRIIPVSEKIKPSFFELTVAMSFDYFAYKKVKYAVIETGMGGRLDSTNVLKPILSVITNIGKDHIQFLGDTLPKIAAEKAGIIKNGVPVIVGESHAETKAVFEEKAKEMNTDIFFADLYYQVKSIKSLLNHQEFKIIREGKTFEKRIVSDLTGSYQTKNMPVLLMVIESLNRKIKIKKKAIKKGLKDVKKQTGLMGRWDLVRQEPKVILDSAHNLNGFHELKNQLRNVKYNNLYIVYGTVNDKDLASICPVLPQDAFYIFTQASIPRSMDLMELYKAAKFYSLKGVTCASVKLAYLCALDMAKRDDLVLITGSNFVVAEALRDLDFNKKI